MSIFIMTNPSGLNIKNIDSSIEFFELSYRVSLSSSFFLFLFLRGRLQQIKNSSATTTCAADGPTNKRILALHMLLTIARYSLVNLP